MARWQRLWLTRAALALLALAGLFGVLVVGGAFQPVRWVGGKDLEITFVVTDADTGQPIRGAAVEVLREGTNFCADRGPAPFRLVTGTDGTARRRCKACMCSGTKGLFTDTFGIHVPGWLVRVSAAGYASSEVFDLGTFGPPGAARRRGGPVRRAGGIAQAPGGKGGRPAMTEAEWLAGTDPAPMLDFLRGEASDRKLRLFACACCRRIWSFLTDIRSREAVEAAENFADQVIKLRDLERARGRASNTIQSRSARMAWYATALQAAVAAREVAAWSAPGIAVIFLVDIFGPLSFRRVMLNPAWLAWQGGTAPKLAQAIYEERQLPSGHLDRARSAVLADALEEAGCDNADLLNHLRGPGPHVRGCWVIDLLLGKG